MYFVEQTDRDTPSIFYFTASRRWRWKHFGFTTNRTSSTTSTFITVQTITSNHIVLLAPDQTNTSKRDDNTHSATPINV